MGKRMNAKVSEDEKKQKSIVAKEYKGMKGPRVELGDDSLHIRVTPEAPKSKVGEKADDKTIRISLENIVVDMHNQSYGMVSASTGCISNPGGPGC